MRLALLRGRETGTRMLYVTSTPCLRGRLHHMMEYAIIRSNDTAGERVRATFVKAEKDCKESLPVAGLEARVAATASPRNEEAAARGVGATKP